MPVQTSPPAVPDSFPSFMSVFGGCSPGFPDKDENGPNKTLRPTTNVSLSSKHRLPFPHRESVSSITTGSTESSPTTTISTFDSNSVADTSASSSPESPLSMPYPKFMPPARNVESLSMSVVQEGIPRRGSDVPMQKRQDSPGRRDRNLKNLSLRMPPSSQCRPPIATASVVETTSQHHLSAPPSPVHIPPKSSRRKPANLTIQTPSFDKSFSSSITEIGSGQHSLKHAESSPSLFSPSFGPKDGMQLQRSMTHHGARNLSTAENNPSPLQTTHKGNHADGTLHEMDEEDHLNTSESSHRNDGGYPDGPIQIFDTGVYLYLEPTTQEASEFDVIVNVASEVANPFADTNKQAGTIMSTWRNTSRDKGVPDAEPQTAVSEGSFKSAFEYPRSESSSSKSDQSTPEYIHVGWGHNSEILDDLYPLCELIDSRVSQGKKVLVHCQLGVSRSASLVIAYGLYKHQDLDFNTIYGMVKERSCWVGPNMSLIYQLTDFRSRLLRGSPAKSAPSEWFVSRARGTSEPQPDRARTPIQTVTGDAASNAELDSSNTSQTSSGLSAPTSDTSTERPTVSRRLSHKRSLSPRPLSLRQRVRSFAPTCKQFKSESNLRRRADGPSLITTDLPMLDVPEVPSLFSPRTSTFMTGARAAPALPENGPGSPLFSPQIADPRSPHQGNERLIMRNIDELL